MDIDTIAESCGRHEVSISEIRQGVEGYVEITNGHTKVRKSILLFCLYFLCIIFKFK